MVDIFDLSSPSSWPPAALNCSCNATGNLTGLLANGILSNTSALMQEMSVDPWLTKKRVDWKKWWLTKIFFYQKPYVLYGIIAMSELVYRSLRRDDWMPNFIFRSIVKFDFGMKKSSIYSWPKALLTKSSRHFTYLFIHTKCTFSIAMRLFVRNLLEKVPHRVQGSKISQISGHQGSQCVTWSC